VLAKTLELPSDGSTHWSVRRLAAATGLEGAGNSVRRIGAYVGRIVWWSSLAATGCFDISSDLALVFVH
jgi:hypothetical protein